MVIYGDLGIVNNNDNEKKHGSLRWDLNARKKLCTRGLIRTYWEGILNI